MTWMAGPMTQNKAQDQGRAPNVNKGMHGYKAGGKLTITHGAYIDPWWKHTSKCQKQSENVIMMMENAAMKRARQQPQHPVAPVVCAVPRHGGEAVQLPVAAAMQLH